MDDRRRRVRLRPDVLPPHARGRRRRRAPGRRDPLRRDHRLPAASRRSAEACHLPLSAHCAPSLHAHAVLRAPRPLRHLEYFHDHVRIEHMLFDGAPRPARRGARARPSAARARARVQARRTRSASRSERAPMEGAMLRAQRERSGRASRQSRPATTRGRTRRSGPGAATSTPRRWRATLARDASRARSASTPAAARSTRPTARTTARCRSASCVPRTSTTWSPTVAVCRELRRAGSLARRRHQPGGPVLQRRRRDRLLQVPEPVLAIDAGRAHGARASPGCVLDDLRDAGRAASTSPSAPIRRRTTTARSAG